MTEFNPWVAPDEEDLAASNGILGHGTHKRKRISNVETIEMMLFSEREQRSVKDKMLDLLQQFKLPG